MFWLNGKKVSATTSNMSNEIIEKELAVFGQFDKREYIITIPPKTIRICSSSYTQIPVQGHRGDLKPW